MSYLVLARKYRPQAFDGLIGQDHITGLLKKAIESNRIAHAFLFCGPRGIGKTSCARILAKSLNCQTGPTLNPCGTCSACMEIANGNSFDVIEIDGASNRGIDEIRTLRENVKFAPAYGRYKIYIVDEVHMLTSEAFNALLKTLEEPPGHVKFIFATTEANKVPSTILSRCQRFDFKRISIETTMANLQGICQKEKLKIEEGALFAIAKASQGSMRDALSILDQLSALGAEGIDTKDVFSMLGMVETELLFRLTDALVGKDCVEALNIFNEVIERGKDIKQLSRDLTEHFRHLMIVKIGGPTLSHLVDYPAAVKQRLQQQAEKITIPGILRAIELFIEAQETARVMETVRMPLELAFAKLTYGGSQPAAVVLAPAAAVSPNVIAKPAPAIVVPKAGVPAAPQPSQSSKPAVVVSGGQGLNLELVRDQWNAVTHEVSRQRMSLATYLQDGILYGFKDGKLTIGFLKEQKFQMENLAHRENLALLEKICLEKLGSNIGIILKLVDDVPPKQEETVVKSALEMFGGQVVNEWHNGD